MHKVLKLGPIGKGYVQEIKTKNGTRFVARWNAYVQSDDGERIRVTCGPHELGPKVPHGPGLKSIKDARKEWEKVYWTVFSQHHPAAALKSSKSGHTASATTSVKDFITSEFEARRRAGWEENSRLNWEYYRDSFILPFFGNYTIAEKRQNERIPVILPVESGVLFPTGTPSSLELRRDEVLHAGGCAGRVT